jgi:hypothetical protein
MVDNTKKTYYAFVQFSEPRKMVCPVDAGSEEEAIKIVTDAIGKAPGFQIDKITDEMPNIVDGVVSDEDAGLVKPTIN